MSRSLDGIQKRTSSETPSLCNCSNADCKHFVERSPLLLRQSSVLPVDLIERSRVVEAAIPHLVHYSRSMHIIFACRSIHDRQRGSSPHTFLQLLRKLPLAPRPELSAEAALAGQC